MVMSLEKSFWKISQQQETQKRSQAERETFLSFMTAAQANENEGWS